MDRQIGERIASESLGKSVSESLGNLPLRIGKRFGERLWSLWSLCNSGRYIPSQRVIIPTGNTTESVKYSGGGAAC